jgi:hypothetical protein
MNRKTGGQQMAIQIRILRYIMLMILLTILSLPSLSLAESEKNSQPENVDTAEIASSEGADTESKKENKDELIDSDAALSDEVSTTSKSTLESEESELLEKAKTADEAT